MGRDRLARVLAQRYGYNLTAVEDALAARRRIRVRAGIEEAVAAQLKAELEALGAIVIVGEPAAGRAQGESTPTTTLPRGAAAPPPTTSPPRGTPAAAPPATPSSPRGTLAPLPAVNVPGLGALSGASGRFQLSALDGSDADQPPPQQPVTTAVTASPTPIPAPDLFGPPMGDEVMLELQEIPQRRGTVAAPDPPPRMSVPMPVEPRQSAPFPAPPRDSGPYVEPPPLPPPVAPRRPLSLPSVDLRALRRDPNARLAAGLGLALLIGFVPAHVYALHAEDRLDDIRLELVHQPPPQTDAEYELAVNQFDLARERMLRVRNRIAVVAGILWILAGSGVCYGFLRFIPEE